jgi:Smr domain
MKIDLHGKTKEEAMYLIFQELRRSWSTNDATIEIVHGHKHGTVLKNYIESSIFIQDCDDEGLYLNRVTDNNPGSSKFKLIIEKSAEGNKSFTLGDFIEK